MSLSDHAALHDEGGRHKMAGRLVEAERSLRAALKILPDSAITQHALGIVLLSQGRYAEGWPYYEARHEIPDLAQAKPPLPYPEWRGENPSGKRILIFGEQGLGDQIMFARFAPYLQSQGAEVTLLCHPALEDLFRSLGVHVIAMSGPVEFPDPDYWVMSGDLAGRAGITLETIPSQPYLSASAARSASHIGIVTRGNPRHRNDANRSLPPELGAELLALTQGISLRPEDTGATTFAETAAIIAGLDLVISVDTSVAHLAGAMGKPVWTLLSGVMTDWRWLAERSDSPWYPSMRLLRQPAPGDWRSVVADVRSRLGRGA